MPPTERDIPVSVIKRASLLLESFDAEHSNLTLAELTRATDGRVTALMEEETYLAWEEAQEPEV